MRFVTAIIHPVESLEAAEDFFCTALGFYHSQNQGNSGLLLENGSVILRLIKNANPISKSLNLELYSRQLDDDTQALLAFSGIALISKNVLVNLYRIETQLQAPHGVTITLFQEFNEDDLGILPPLPISLDWEEQALNCIQQSLTYVPIDFRQPVRTLITERAEVLTAEQGEITVDLKTAVQALAETTPHFQHPTLVAALRERGIDPSRHFKEPVL